MYQYWSVTSYIPKDDSPVLQSPLRLYGEVVVYITMLSGHTEFACCWLAGSYLVGLLIFILMSSGQADEPLLTAKGPTAPRSCCHKMTAWQV